MRNPVQQSAPLWRQLQTTASLLQDLRAGVSGTAALDKVAADLRPGVQSLFFHVLRSLGRAQALRTLLVSRTPPGPADALLCTALALCWQEQDAPYESFTLVNQTVEAAKKTPASRAQASFINACLRRFMRERDELLSATDHDSVARWNHPAWWIDRLRKEWPQSWQAMLSANNEHAPMTLRVNSRRTDVQGYLDALRHAGMDATAAGQHGLVLDQPRPVHDLPGFQQGAVSVQDEAAQLAAPLLLMGLNVDRPPRVLDACAAPGGKTAHLLELSDCDVTALDVDAMRCERIHQTLRRLGLHARVLAVDASNLSTWWDGEPFDAILLDAPCSASGVVRRHPDIRWLRREADIAKLVSIQAGLLQVLWTTLKPGGRLLYCTCSVFRAEGEEQIQTFLAHNTQAGLLPSPGHLTPRHSENGAALQDNGGRDHDGFYYALLEKHAS